ncbi:MAG: hypothetical protein ACLPLP_13350 [Mycobacterium sp.]
MRPCTAPPHQPHGDHAPRHWGWVDPLAPLGGDAGLKDKLRAEADAVLSWVIGGWCDYRERGGLDEPAAVLVRTGDYKSESDAIGRFIDDECDVGGAQSAAKTGALYASWQTWATRKDASR